MAEYDPKGHGKEKTVESIRFVEAEPPAHLSEIVHRYLELRTDEPVAEDYRFHALPDACTYMIFNQLEPEIVGVTGLRAASEELNLGTKFHYVNIRFFPGVWRFNRERLSHGQVADPYSGELPLVDVNRRLMGLAFDSQQSILSEFVEYLVEEKVVMANPVTRRHYAKPRRYQLGGRYGQDISYLATAASAYPQARHRIRASRLFQGLAPAKGSGRRPDRAVLRPVALHPLEARTSI